MSKNLRKSALFIFRNSLFYIVFLVGVCGMAYFYLDEIRTRGDKPVSTDFYKFYLSALQVAEKASPYQPAHKLGTIDEPC